MWDTTEIFSYHNGEKEVWGDPLEIYQALTAALGCDVNTLLAQIRMSVYKKEDAPPAADRHAHNVRQSYTAFEKLIPAVRYAFKLKKFEDTGEGAPWAVCIRAFNKLASWCEEQKKNGERVPTPSSAAAAPTCSASITSTSAACG
jgi:hypothetical protein